MINKLIPANTVFSVPANAFGLRSTEACQLSISVDGSNFTAFDVPFSGNKYFCDNPRTSYFKCNKDVYLSY